MSLKFVNPFVAGLLTASVTCSFFPLKFSSTLDLPVSLINFVPVSLEECHEACLARTTCHSIEFDRRFRLCRLSSTDSSITGVHHIHQPGIVYSEKSNWSERYPKAECAECSTTETCVTQQDPVKCTISECSEPSVSNTQEILQGTELSVGSQLLHTCKLSSDKRATSVCQSNGTWSLQGFVCPTVNTDGKRFKIVCVADNKWWHYNGRSSKDVTSQYQTNDDFVKFIFEIQHDNTYKIKSLATLEYMYDGFQGGSEEWLNADDNSDDDNMRYIVTMETQDVYRIQTKSTGRYVRLDSDKHVSTRYNIEDQNSLFRLTEV